MRLRLAVPDDAAALADLGQRAFVAKFGHLYRPQDLATFLASAHAPEVVQGELTDPGIVTAVIESDAGGAPRLLAFCKLRVESSLPGVSGARRPLELKQLYADPDHIGGGLGGRLMEWALAEARERGADEMQLSVWSENPGAQRFYARYGFVRAGEIDFWVGDQRDEDWLFVLPLD